MTGEQHPLWDLPVRLFHWSIVLCLPLAWFSAETERYDLHAWVGYTVIVLVAARVIWGFVGSEHARFSDFLKGPRTVLAYVRGQHTDSAGHNPLGGWSVVVLLGLLLLQGVSGLFNSDDVFFSGPLYYAADYSETEFRDTMGAVHDWAFNLLLAFVGLHILAVIYHQRWRGEPLLQAMLRGRAAGRVGRSRPVPAWRALLLAAVLALLFWWGLQQAPQPPPMTW